MMGEFIHALHRLGFNIDPEDIFGATWPHKTPSLWDLLYPLINQVLESGRLDQLSLVPGRLECRAVFHLSLESLAWQVCIDLIKHLYRKVLVAQDSLNHQQVTDSITNSKVCHLEQTDQPFSFRLVLLAFKKLVEFVPFDLDRTVAIGLVVCPNYILRGHGVGVFYTCWDEDMFDEVCIEELATVAISVGSLYEHLQVRRQHQLATQVRYID